MCTCWYLNLIFFSYASHSLLLYYDLCFIYIFYLQPGIAAAVQFDIVPRMGSVVKLLYCVFLIYWRIGNFDNFVLVIICNC